MATHRQRSFEADVLSCLSINSYVISMGTQDDIDDFGELWSLMYCVFAREMADSFGEEGKKAIIRAVKAYGVARGARLRELHEEQGLPINLRSLFEHYDLPGHSGTEKTRTVTQKTREPIITPPAPVRDRAGEPYPGAASHHRIREAP